MNVQIKRDRCIVTQLGATGEPPNALASGTRPKGDPPAENYFTSSDPHHDTLGGGCQVRVVIENMMGSMENWRTLISGFLGLVILVRWALVTMFLSWTTQTGCRIHRTYVSLIGSTYNSSPEMCSVTLNFADCLEAIFWRSFWHIFWHSFWHIFWHSFWHLSDISFDILSDKSFDTLSDISSDNFSDRSFDMLSDISSDILSDISKPKPNIHSFTKKPLCKLYIYLTPRSKSTIHNNCVPVNVIALSASDSPAKKQLSPKMQNACSSTHTHTTCIRPPRQKSSWVQEMQSWQWCRNYISWPVQTMKPDACHCGSFTSSV